MKKLDLASQQIKVRTVASPKSTKNDVQITPLILSNASEYPVQGIKVDFCFRTESKIFVVGWSTTSAVLALQIGNRASDVRTIPLPRPDVARHLNLSDDNVGFVLVADNPGNKNVALTWMMAGETLATSLPLQFVDQPSLSQGERHLIGHALSLVALSLVPHTPEWRSLVTMIPISIPSVPNVKGYLEGASSCGQSQTAIVVGWLVQQPGSVAWLEDDYGKTFPIEGAYRRFRKDVLDAVGPEFAHVCGNAGLIALMRGFRPGSKITIKSLSALGVQSVAETACAVLPADPIAMARWLFSIGTPLADLHKRVPMIDEPVLGPLMESRQQLFMDLPLVIKQLGVPADAPIVSIIIPLYGRSDFVEHQLIEFYKDPWLLENAEIIYVLDDPKLVESFSSNIESLHRVYGIPLKWIWGSTNRGFAGANNLGAAEARGKYFIFLNSDAFPQHSGWAKALLDVLKRNTSIGAVGPRLVFADGSIQHAGMEFRCRNELGIWINHHPNMGLDPCLDPHKTLTIVPSITGACLALRRSTFLSVGGWDTGYLIGDFEDSDLCLKLRADGLDIAYLPTVQITHLERQSFKMLGQDDFRMGVVIYNAIRHQNRWKALISQVPANPHAIHSNNS